MMWQPQVTPVIECIHELQRVESTLANLIARYNKQIREHQMIARNKLHSKAECLIHIKKIRIIRFHKNHLERRVEACMQKRYHLEAINVTKMHIMAVKHTSKTFSRFLQQNDVEKISALQDKLTDMIQDACEITEILQEDEFAMGDEDVEEDYQQMINEIQTPAQSGSASKELSQTHIMDFPSVPIHSPGRASEGLLRLS